WFADRGFAVIVAEGRGPASEREVHGHRAALVPTGQVAAPHATAVAAFRAGEGATAVAIKIATAVARASPDLAGGRSPVR
ncbi:hypothetical protein, partial [Actinoallomurus acaciae]